MYFLNSNRDFESKKAYAENKEVFTKHFDALAKHYPNQSQRIIVVNLVEESGKESLLGDAFVEQLAELDRETVTYVQFDFHEHWSAFFQIFYDFLRVFARATNEQNSVKKEQKAKNIISFTEKRIKMV
jgi:hypothetical protein